MKHMMHMKHGSCKKTVRFDISNSDLKDISVGDNVTVKVKGKVTMLEAEDKASKEDKKEYDAEDWPAQMQIDLMSVDIEEDTNNEFEDLAEGD